MRRAEDDRRGTALGRDTVELPGWTRPDDAQDLDASVGTNLLVDLLSPPLALLTEVRHDGRSLELERSRSQH